MFVISGVVGNEGRIIGKGYGRNPSIGFPGEPTQFAEIGLQTPNLRAAIRSKFVIETAWQKRSSFARFSLARADAQAP